MNSGLLLGGVCVYESWLVVLCTTEGRFPIGMGRHFFLFFSSFFVLIYVDEPHGVSLFFPFLRRPFFFTFFTRLFCWKGVSFRILLLPLHPSLYAQMATQYIISYSPIFPLCIFPPFFSLLSNYSFSTLPLSLSLSLSPLLFSFASMFLTPPALSFFFRGYCFS